MSKKLIEDKKAQIALLTKDIDDLSLAEKDTDKELLLNNVGRCFVIETSWARELYPIYRTIHRIIGVSEHEDSGYVYEIDAFCVKKSTVYVEIFTKFETVRTDRYDIENYTEITSSIYVQLKNYYNKWLVDFATGFDQIITRQLLEKDVEKQPVILVKPSKSE